MDLKGTEPGADSGRRGKSLPPLRLQDIGLPKLVLVVVAGIALLVFSLPSAWTGGFGGRSGRDTGSGAVNGSTEAVTAMEAYTDKKEEQLEKILEKVQGIGQVDVMITLDSAEEKNKLLENTRVQKVEGVLVVAQGAGEAQMDAEIIRAVQALFSLEPHKIRVMKME